ncbi:hypothetical protein AU381_00130 [Sinorhizobium glycinis]|uniref:Uncharacterized protein n=1 Tax=Sinorhizobium glycinis TaxID=1472378 RepID=A0A178XYJ1_9HYPH|nr:hypothetical protein [Sinorhizobium glycinis]OAP40370.1 hypothetical protein AU381_00130 [Sinorhizobium glycinis]
MNEFAGFTKAVPGGFWAMLRFARDSHPKPVLTEGEKPHVFPTELDALRAINRHLLSYFNGDYRRDGVRCEAAKAAAERLFRNGREIAVERRSA